MILKKHPPVVRKRIRFPDGTVGRIPSSFTQDPVPVRGLTDMSDQNLLDWLHYWNVEQVTAH